MTKLEQRLQIVWNNHAPKRYQPRSLNGGTAWGVYDFKEGRFLKNKEVLKVKTDALLTETLVHEAPETPSPCKRGDGMTTKDKKHCFLCRGYRLVRVPGSSLAGWRDSFEKCPMCRPKLETRRVPPMAADADNSKLFSQRRFCVDCEEEFNLGEMYPGKRHIDPPECPYCRSPRSASVLPATPLQS